MIQVSVFIFNKHDKKIFLSDLICYDFDIPTLIKTIIKFNPPDTLFLETVRISTYNDNASPHTNDPPDSTTYLTITHPRFVHTREDYEQ